jgi:hypothetical protein
VPLNPNRLSAHAHFPPQHRPGSVGSHHGAIDQSGSSLGDDAGHYLPADENERSGEENVLCCGCIAVSRQVLRPGGFLEIQTWFLVHAVVSCLVQAVTILVMGVLEEDLSSAASSKDRLRQDVFTIPSAIVFFSLFSMLLHILHYLKDARDLLHERRDVHQRRGLASLAWIVGFYLAMGTLESHFGHNLVEWASSVNAAIFAVAFFVSGRYLSSSVAEYGNSTVLVAQKLRRVSFLVGWSMLVRFVLFLPAMQSALGESIGKFATCILEVWMLVPYVSSMQLLHQKPSSS